MNRATGGNNWAATVQEYFNGNNNALPNSHARNQNANNWEGPGNGHGYGPNFKGYSMGPGYYGKTFFIWPPDPRYDAGADPSQPSPTDPKKDVNGKHICDWRKRFFC